MAEQTDQPTGVPTCYRHPDRETYIRCSRCERHICPDCMTAAPVGFQCPECLADGRKTVRQAKTPFGGEIRQNGDLITKSLIAINVMVWLVGMLVGQGSLSRLLLQLSGGNYSFDEITARFGLVMGFADDPIQYGLADGEWYRLITAAFVHEEILHIGMNMVVLWFIGSALEPVLGRWRFITLYLLSALGGSAASLMSGLDLQLSIGASGAVYGLFGALFVVMRRLGRDVTFILVLLGINLVFGFTIPGIDWRAHLGGLVVGTALAYAFAHAPRERRTAWGIAASAAAVVTTLAVVAAITL